MSTLNAVNPYPGNDMAASGFFFAMMGGSIAMALSNLGAAYGTAKSAIGISSMSTMKP